MKKLLTLTFLLACVSLVWADEIKVEVDLDRENHTYTLDENAQFTVKVTDANGELVKEGQLQCVFTNDNRIELNRETVDLSQSNPATVSGNLGVPGFRHVQRRFRAWRSGF